MILLADLDQGFERGGLTAPQDNPRGGPGSVRFGLDEAATPTVECKCVCPEKKKVGLAVIDSTWWSALAICNSNDTPETVTIKIGTTTAAVSVAANSCISKLVSEIVPLVSYGNYPMTYEANDGVSVTVVIGKGDGMFGEQF